MVEGLVSAISLWMARVGGLLLLVASFIISFEIIARKTLHLPFNVGTELSTYALAVGASWSFSYVLLHRAHVRIDILRGPLSPLGRAAMDVLALSSLTAVAFILCWHVAATVATSWNFGAHENTPLSTPLVIPQGLWLVGLLWFAMVCVYQLARTIRAFVRGDLKGVVRMAGPAGDEEEVEEALAGAQARIGQAN